MLGQATSTLKILCSLIREIEESFYRHHLRAKELWDLSLLGSLTWKCKNIFPGSLTLWLYFLNWLEIVSTGKSLPTAVTSSTGIYIATFYKSTNDLPSSTCKLSYKKL